MAEHSIATSVNFNLPRSAVWNGIFDIEVMRRCIPGCEELELVNERQLRVTVKYKIGPITRRFRTSVTITDIVPGEFVRFRRGGLEPFRGSGAFSGEARFQDNGSGTRADATITIDAPTAVVKVIKMIYFANPETASRGFVTDFEKAVHEVAGQQV